MDAVRVGLAIRALRRQHRLTQVELGRRSGLSGPTISRIERGRVGRATLGRLDRICQELGARLTVSVQWQGEALDRLLDAEHARLVEWTIRWLRSSGWEALPEVTFQIGNDRGSIDVLARHATRALLVVEVKSTIPDAQATLSTLDRKARVARTIASDRGWVGSGAASRLLVVPSDRTTRRRIEALFATFDSALPTRTAAIKAWIAAPVGAVAGILFVPNLPHTQGRHRVSGRAPRQGACRVHETALSSAKRSPGANLTLRD